jgi:hypothetical protein
MGNLAAWVLPEELMRLAAAAVIVLKPPTKQADKYPTPRTSISQSIPLCLIFHPSYILRSSSSNIEGLFNHERPECFTVKRDYSVVALPCSIQSAEWEVCVLIHDEPLVHQWALDERELRVLDRATKGIKQQLESVFGTVLYHKCADRGCPNHHKWYTKHYSIPDGCLCLAAHRKIERSKRYSKGIQRASKEGNEEREVRGRGMSRKAKDHQPSESETSYRTGECVVGKVGWISQTLDIFWPTKNIEATPILKVVTTAGVVY